ncbi:MAG: DUF1841 family protein [Candidatus Berkiellales bacterium]
MIENDPIALRKVYYDAWQKHLQGVVLSAMEAIIVDIIERHPEYQPIFADPKGFEEFQQEKFQLDHNPFFHLALHVTIAEQVGADRPTGIQAIYTQLLHKFGDKTKAEHKMMDCLARILVTSFQKNQPANEQDYLGALQTLV